MRVGLLWRREWDPPSENPRQTSKLHGIFAALEDIGVDAVPVVYSDDAVELVGEQLLTLDGVLVWVNPIEHELDRSTLDPLLRDAAREGVFVSAHPDVILKMGTKRVLWDTRELGWGSDVHLYHSSEQLLAELPARLAEAPRVLKQYRGMGGSGVWKVEGAPGDAVTVQHASSMDAAESMPLAEFVDRCQRYFESGPMIDQPYMTRLSAGMIRAYLAHDQVVGFTRQYPRGLMPPGPDARPKGKIFELPTAPAYTLLRERLESEWVPQMQRILDIKTAELPVIWDADFLFSDDDYVLCEINVSSTFAFPEFAMATVAEAAQARITERALL